MAKKFSYSGDPSSSPRDGCRFWLGDTDERRPLFGDFELDALVNIDTDPRMAAASACDILATRFAREADFTAGSVSKSWSQIATAYKTRADSLRAVVGRDALPFFGGQSRSGKQLLDADPDAVGPLARFRMGDDPQALQFDDHHSSLERLGFWP